MSVYYYHGELKTGGQLRKLAEEGKLKRDDPIQVKGQNGCVTAESLGFFSNSVTPTQYDESRPAQRGQLLVTCAKCDAVTPKDIACQHCFGTSWGPMFSTDGSAGWFCTRCKNGYTSFSCGNCGHKTPVLINNMGILGLVCTNVVASKANQSVEQALREGKGQEAAAGCVWLFVTVFIIGVCLLGAVLVVMGEP